VRRQFSLSNAGNPARTDSAAVRSGGCPESNSDWLAQSHPSSIPVPPLFSAVCPSTTILVGHEPSIGHRKERITESATVDGVIEICGCRPRPPESNPFEATSPVDVVVVRVELAQGVGIHDVNDGVFSGLQGYNRCQVLPALSYRSGNTGAPQEPQSESALDSETVLCTVK